MKPGLDTIARDPSDPDVAPDITGIARLLGEPARAACEHRWLEIHPGEHERTEAVLTSTGAEALGVRGIDIAGVLGGRRPPCLACMDWSERRPHAAGALGSAVLALCLSRRWARRTPGSRTVAFSAAGERAFSGTLCR